MGYNPNEPRNASGEWTDAGNAIRKAASDKKGFTNGGTHSWTVDKFIDWVEQDHGPLVKSGYSKLSKNSLDKMFETYIQTKGLDEQINEEGLNRAFKELKKRGIAK